MQASHDPIILGTKRYTHVDQTGDVTSPQVVQDGGLVQVGQVSHVGVLLELRGVHLLQEVLLQCPAL